MIERFFYERKNKHDKSIVIVCVSVVKLYATAAVEVAVDYEVLQPRVIESIEYFKRETRGVISHDIDDEAFVWDSLIQSQVQAIRVQWQSQDGGGACLRKWLEYLANRDMENLSDRAYWLNTRLELLFNGEIALSEGSVIVKKLNDLLLSLNIF